MRSILTFLLLLGPLVQAAELRVMTYNIHHGEGTDGKFDLERIAKVILAEMPDLVAIQEVDVKTGRSRGVDQAAELIRLTGMEGRFGKFMDFNGGEYGQMVLSRFPIKAVMNHPLPRGPEPRASLAIDVELPDGKPLVFVGNHLYMTEAERLAQAKALREAVGTDPEARVILAGDFNSEPGESPMRYLRERWSDPGVDAIAPTWPSDGPKVEIDYILVPTAFRKVRYEVLGEKVASDHRPLVGVFKYGGEG
jgi:endonuclease/exonuclease/phosphatase family metal-dependent hydrolase